MIGKVIGAIAGERASRHFRSIGGPGGAILGAGSVALMRRLGPLGLVAGVLGGYALKRYQDRDRRRPRLLAAPPRALPPAQSGTQAEGNLRSRPTGQGFNDPDRQNSEQNEEGTQAQDVTEDALNKKYPRESDPGETSNPADLVPRDVPDLVEKERDMVRSGHIDMDAFEGEPKMDDEDR